MPRGLSLPLRLGMWTRRSGSGRSPRRLSVASAAYFRRGLRQRTPSMPGVLRPLLEVTWRTAQQRPANDVVSNHCRALTFPACPARCAFAIRTWSRHTARRMARQSRRSHSGGWAGAPDRESPAVICVPASKGFSKQSHDQAPNGGRSSLRAGPHRRPVSDRLQAGIRFARSLDPARPSAVLAVGLPPATPAAGYRASTFRNSRDIGLGACCPPGDRDPRRSVLEPSDSSPHLLVQACQPFGVLLLTTVKRRLRCLHHTDSPTSHPASAARRGSVSRLHPRRHVCFDALSRSLLIQTDRVTWWNRWFRSTSCLETTTAATSCRNQRSG